MTTAEEFFKQKYKELGVTWKNGDIKQFREEDIVIAIEFAKLHCIEQARVISEKAKIDWSYLSGVYIVPDEDSIKINKESILNAYDLSNIK